MALVYEGMLCALCGKPLNPEDCFATTHFLEPSHPLHEYSDSAMHWSCHDAWPARHSFARAHFVAWVEQQELSPHWGLVYHSERVAVAMSAPPSERVCLAVSSTIAFLQVDVIEWEHLCTGRMELPHVRSADLSAIADVLPELRDVLPHASIIRGRLDVGALEAGEKHLLEEQEARERAKMERLRDHQRRWEKARREGTLCPHCGERSAVREVDCYPRGRSYFICRTCSRTFEGAREE